MKNSYPSFVIAGAAALLTCSLLVGCSSKKTTDNDTVSETITEPPAKPSYSEKADTVLSARVQAISRKNRILTLKFPDDKVAKVKVGPQVHNFSEIGVGDTIKATFHDEVEVFVVGPTGKPVWEEIEEIKPKKGVKPGAAVIRAYEYSATVMDIDYTTRKVTLKGPAGKLIRVTGRPDIRRFKEIKTGDTVVARFIEALDIDVAPPERPSSTSRPYRRR